MKWSQNYCSYHRKCTIGQMRAYAEVFFNRRVPHFRLIFKKKTFCNFVRNFVRNGYLDSAHVFTLEKAFQPFGTSTQINST